MRRSPMPQESVQEVVSAEAVRAIGQAGAEAVVGARVLVRPSVVHQGDAEAVVGAAVLLQPTLVHHGDAQATVGAGVLLQPTLVHHGDAQATVGAGVLLQPSLEHHGPSVTNRPWRPPTHATTQARVLTAAISSRSRGPQKEASDAWTVAQDAFGSSDLLVGGRCAGEFRRGDLRVAVAERGAHKKRRGRSGICAMRSRAQALDGKLRSRSAGATAVRSTAPRRARAARSARGCRGRASSAAARRAP